jgi:ATP-dependent Lhr-like helicase
MSWIWKQGWETLRDIQEQSIPILVRGDRDLIISAGTASGKTEAAFLPIVSNLASADRPPGAGWSALYISPMKALLNDQMGRMETLCEEVDIEVTKWHGDVAASTKAKARKRPGGILLITPESLEALLMRRGNEIARLFQALTYVVVDEMHAFMGSPRGKQLQSIMHRIDVAAGVQPCRVGLSATLADELSSKKFLRPSSPAAVTILPGGAGGQDLKLQLRGYISESRGEKRRRLAIERAAADEADGQDKSKIWTDSSEAAITRHLFETLRGGRSLIFAGSRNRVETTTLALTGLSEAIGTPQEFFPHHGNLSRELREQAEVRLKDIERPASIVCTTTLELGIDVGPIDSVAQLGPGQTVSGMRQRVGRTGRRAGQPSVMRVYVREVGLDETTHPLDALRRDTVQSIAMLNLMLAKWNEPPSAGQRHLSTLLHQVLALIAQHGGISPRGAWALLVESQVFEMVDHDLFKGLLRQMASEKLIEQAVDGTLLPGPEGEKVLESREAYSVFKTPAEFKVISDGGRLIGQIPVENYLSAGQLAVLGGRRWRVFEVHSERREIVVTAATGGMPPVFGGEPKAPEDGVIQEMWRVYQERGTPRYLDPAAARLLHEGRETFERLGLGARSIVPFSDTMLIFPWVGERRLTALLLELTRAGLETTHMGLALAVPAAKQRRLEEELVRIARSPPPDPITLARLVEQNSFEKYDDFLSEEQRTLAYATGYMDAESLPNTAARILSNTAHLGGGAS